MAATSNLSFIEVKNNTLDPFSLLNEWIREVEEAGAVAHLMNLATANREGRVSNRTIVIREIMPDGALAFLSQRSSNKVKEIKENPQVAATILLKYVKDNRNITKQIRYTGKAEELSYDHCKTYFERDNLPGKIRSLICQDSGPSNWNELKQKHDQLLKDIVENKKKIEMPDSLVAFKIVADEVDFYFSREDEIADRILFKLDNNTWNYGRIMP